MIGIQAWEKEEGGRRPFLYNIAVSMPHLLYSIVPLFFYLNICCLSFFLFSSWLYRDHAEGWLAFFYFLSFFYLKLLDKLGAMRELHLVSFPIRLLSASSSSSINNRGKQQVVCRKEDEKEEEEKKPHLPPPFTMILYIQPGYMGRVFPVNWPSKVLRGRNETKPSCVCACSCSTPINQIAWASLVRTIPIR